MNFGRSGPHVARMDSGAKVITYNLNKARLHTYIAPEKYLGNATHVIESPNYLIVVDTQYAIPASQEFRNYINTLNKPIAGVIISHAHPDHYFGLSTAFNDVPSYAISEVIADIKNEGHQMIEQSKKEMGDLIPNEVNPPTNELELGEVNIDGIKYIYKKFDKAEADTQVVIELPEINTVIVQDAVYNGYHPWLGKYTDGWIDMLNKLKDEYKDDYIVLVGHGTPGSPEIYDEMKKYLLYSKKVLSESHKDKNIIINKLTSEYPNYKGKQIIPMYLSYLYSNGNNNDKNPVNWFEIPVDNMDRAIKFYQTVLGYKLEKIPPFPSSPNFEQVWFPSVMNGEGAAGSLVKGPYYRPSSKGVMIYFRSPSGDLTNELNKVEKAGGKVIQSKRIINEQIGNLGIFMDTEGNKISLHSKK